jgi:predicted Rossmann-fold nucleotide-binding protein
MKSICVYCGSNFNGDPILRTAIEGLAQALTDQDITLVYGGGSVGVMGVIADEVLKRNGKVTGVIPQFLLDKEVGHQSLTQMIVTENMHERKQTMADLSDGFIAIGVLNVGGFYDPLFAQMDVMVAHRFLKPANRDLVFNESDPFVLIDKMSKFDAVPDEVWFKDRNLT